MLDGFVTPEQAVDKIADLPVKVCVALGRLPNTITKSAWY